MPETHTETMELQKSTKGAYQYKSPGPLDNNCVGMVYVRRSQIGDNPPPKIKVTVEELRE